jgi:hypothetical protein
MQTDGFGAGSDVRRGIGGGVGAMMGGAVHTFRQGRQAADAGLTRVPDERPPAVRHRPVEDIVVDCP